jgi:hypothetical protein
MIHKKQYTLFFILFSVIGLFGCGETTTTTADGTSTDGTSTTTVVTISGQVALSAEDLQLAQNTANAVLEFQTARPKFQTVATSTLPNAAVTLVKIKADGTESVVTGVSATTDSSGNYTLEGVPSATTGTGSSDDFYYEVRATSGKVVVSGPTAPTSSGTVNLSPETKLAANMISSVAKIPGSSTSVLPGADVINNVREIVKDDVADISTSIIVPSSRTSAEDDVSLTATAIASAGGNSEKILRAFEAEKEHQLVSKAGTDVSAASPYLERVIKQGCNYNSEFNLPNTARGTLAQAFVSDKKITVTKLVDAYNANNGSDPDVVVSSVVNSTKAKIEGIETQLKDKTVISSDSQQLLYVKRDLESTSFKHTTELDMDQALAVTQGVFNTACQPGNFDMVGFIADATVTDKPTTPTFVDIKLFHDSGFGCQGNTGHLRATAEMYSPGTTTVNNVSIAASGVTFKKSSFDSVGTNGSYSRWELSKQDADATCVSFSKAIEYTLTATLSDTSTISQKVSRTHLSVPEASVKFASTGDKISKNSNSPTATNAKRPIFEWSPAPGDASVTIKEAPTGSQLKFTFELAYIDKSDVQVSPLQNCELGGSGQRLMDRNYFMSDVDCDVAACATKSGRDANNIICRTNVQTFLVDENDRVLGQAAGNFAFYCVSGVSGCI